MTAPPILARQNWNTRSQIPGWRETAREHIEQILASIVDLETRLTEWHDHAHLQTMEFHRAAEHLGSAWRAANFALGSLQ